jgi:hypothetical protein
VIAASQFIMPMSVAGPVDRGGSACRLQALSSESQKADIAASQKLYGR